MPDRNEPAGPYTRHRMKIQLGDGPDRRGETTVELVREPQPTETEPVEIELANGTTVAAEVPRDHRTFAEFYAETERAEQLLRRRLGMEGRDG